jgi:hypothetical protein
MRTQKRGGKGWWPFTKRDQRSPTKRVYAQHVEVVGDTETRVSNLEQKNSRMLVMMGGQAKSILQIREHMRSLQGELAAVRSELVKFGKSPRSA